jgi:hypothetical protein
MRAATIGLGVAKSAFWWLIGIEDRRRNVRGVAEPLDAEERLSRKTIDAARAAAR